ncbi:MAG: dephospho-CoA kinase [Opitutaceae bacterium]|nr:dephospho-CoA kinase [Opitutaceae bacterium]
MILGLTGGIGCGKTTTAKMLVAHGLVPLDSDAIIREILQNDRAVIVAIRAHFGPGVFAGSDVVSRSRLARRVFSDEAALRWLEDLLHPRLYAYWRTAFSAQPSRSWVVEVPLLFEKSLQNWFDFTVCVASHPSVQLARLEQRGLSPPLARKRISKQLPLAQKIVLADFVLLNDGSSDFLRDQVATLVSSLSTL